MAQLPRDSSLDGTVALFRDGYTFISKRCAKLRSDAFETRLLLRPVVCMKGEEAAKAFYAEGRFTRRGAIPAPVLKLLQDRGSVATLDGEAHRHRKAMFMSLMDASSIERLCTLAADEWRNALRTWERQSEVILFDETPSIFCRAVCAWAGVPLHPSEAGQRTSELTTMFRGAGSFGPRNWRAMLLRERSERWARDIIKRMRAAEIEGPEGSAVNVIAWHREPDGNLLDTKVAAVELLNVLRPTVAVSQFASFAAVALHEYPESREKLRSDSGYLELFVQEVRRFYPFFPAVGGRVLEEFEWKGRRFKRGMLVLLDLYGTDQDATTWDSPDVFRPERFRQWNRNAYSFIPQGGGDFYTNHRCPGEWITIELLKTSVRMLTTAMRYDVPAQDLRVDLSKVPAAPESRLVINNVRSTGKREPVENVPNSALL